MHTRLLCAATFLAVAAACNARPRDAADSALAQSDSATARSAAPAPGSCTPLESRPPEVPDEKPVSPGQTRACAVTSQVAYDVTIVASGLEKPWSVEPMPGGDLLVTEKPGRLRVVTAAGQVGEPITGLPKVDARGQGGLQTTRIELPIVHRGRAQRVEVRDVTFLGRVGWSDIVAEPGRGTAVRTSVSSADPANRLRTYRGITLQDPGER